ncbi:MAG TPA: SUMF1/EgtB/PvdO family nonheme iron enzyme, partial [Anaerolineae bacterium]|nr:SUMF1/EgtB/PvdO family nonheme iron enzyme [Anaerolineae bacterium]
MSTKMIGLLCVILVGVACNSTPGTPIPPATADGAPMVLVPAGEFTMGSDLLPNERPIHTVQLNAFWIDQSEVTNESYAKCVAAQQCPPPVEGYSTQHPDGYFANSKYSNFPAANVNWSEADRYCQWAGKRLPTEAEWEKAARGTDARKFPWGNTFDPARANSALNLDLITTAVDSHPNGASPYGAVDMAGNVWEWVADWYDETYYTRSPQANPTGPLTGTMRI